MLTETFINRLGVVCPHADSPLVIADNFNVRHDQPRLESQHGKLATSSRTRMFDSKYD